MEKLTKDFGYGNVHRTAHSLILNYHRMLINFVATAVNRLDRLTSGIMIIPLNTSLAKTLSDEFARGTVRKEYVARCLGKFPS